MTLCPACNLTLTPEDTRSGQCPSCRCALAPVPAASEFPEPAPAKGRSLLPYLLGGVAVLVVGLAVGAILNPSRFLALTRPNAVSVGGETEGGGNSDELPMPELVGDSDEPETLPPPSAVSADEPEEVAPPTPVEAR